MPNGARASSNRQSDQLARAEPSAAQAVVIAHVSASGPGRALLAATAGVRTGSSPPPGTRKIALATGPWPPCADHRCGRGGGDFAFEDDDVGVVSEAVDQGGGDHGVANDLGRGPNPGLLASSRHNPALASEPPPAYRRGLAARSSTRSRWRCIGSCALTRRSPGSASAS